MAVRTGQTGAAAHGHQKSRRGSSCLSEDSHPPKKEICITEVQDTSISVQLVGKK